MQIYGPEDAATIVLTHGILCSLDFWRNQIEALSADYRVVAFDHRGHGRSESARRGHYTLTHLAEDLRAVLRATIAPGRPAVIAGHSLGGIAVMAWAARCPEEVSRYAAAIALVNTTPGEILDNVDFLRGPRSTLAARRRLAQLVAPLAGVPLPRRLPLRRRLLTHVAGACLTPKSARALERMIGATSARGRGGYGALMVDMTATIDPSTITVATMVIAGSRDKIAPPARSALIAGQLPNLIELRELDTGHCGPLECAHDITTALRELTELPADPGLHHGG